MSLYLDYRPKTLDEIKGNKEVISTLTTMLENVDKVPHSILLSGPTGCGKTTIGRIIADKLGCVGSAFREIDIADFRGIDTIRDIIAKSQYLPQEGNCIVWLLDEVQMLATIAASALLKVLEDTPKHVYFILCTTHPQKLLPTIRGRCSHFQVKELSDQQMFSLLRKVAHAEGHKLEKEIAEQIIQDSEGHPRNALQILEQVLCVPYEEQLEVATRYAEKQSQTIELCRALISGKNWSEISKILAGLKNEDVEGIRRVVLGYSQSVLLKSNNRKAAAVMEAFMEPNGMFWNLGFSHVTFACFSVVNG